MQKNTLYERWEANKEMERRVVIASIGTSSMSEMFQWEMLKSKKNKQEIESCNVS